jgi:nucleoside-diphosphate-sugar epimerase
MNILISGGTGFLGKYFYEYWKSIGYSVDSIGRGTKNEIIFDLSKSTPNLSKEYQYFIHCAGKAHVIPQNDKEENEFYLVNENGTKFFLNAISMQSKKPLGVLIVSSVSVYGLTFGHLINEKALLKAKDPYGKSKINSEKIAIEWGILNNIKISIVRLPLVVGKNPPGNLKAMINAIKSEKYFNISGGIAKKSMVLATDVAKFSFSVIKIGGIYNLTDSKHPNFNELSKTIANKYGKNNVKNIPIFAAKILSVICDLLNNIFKLKIPFNESVLNKMISDLTFDDNKARKIGWNPNSVLTNNNKWL